MIFNFFQSAATNLITNSAITATALYLTVQNVAKNSEDTTASGLLSQFIAYFSHHQEDDHCPESEIRQPELLHNSHL